MTASRPEAMVQGPVHLALESVELEGDLVVPGGPLGLVLFAHGSGSSRRSPRNRHVAGVLQQGGLATLLFDLLTLPEEQADEDTGALRFDIGLLAHRVVGALDWVRSLPATKALPLGLFGASTGAAAALVAAARRPEVVDAVVSRGGRPDLAGAALDQVRAPTLLIVGSRDETVLGLNRAAIERMPVTTEAQLEIVPGATHLFEEPGTLDAVAHLALAWFQRHFPGPGS